MTRWYRAYEGTVTDPKLSEAAMVADTSRSVSVAAWHLILENAATVNDGGRIDIPSRRIAAALCEPLATIEVLVEAFSATGLITGSHVTAWKRRQYESDKSTERSRRHRERKKMAEKLPEAKDATHVQRDATDTETETEYPLANANGRDAAPKPMSAADVTKAIFDTGVMLLSDAGHDARKARTIIGRWRKDHKDAAVLSAISRCQQAGDISSPLEWITKSLQMENPNATKPTRSRAGGHGDAINDPWLAACVAGSSGGPDGEGPRSDDGRFDFAGPDR